MRIINSTQYVTTVIVGTQAIHPMGLSIILPSGAHVIGDTFVPMYIRTDVSTNMILRPTLNRFFYAYIFGMLPVEFIIAGYIIRNTVKQVGNEIQLHPKTAITNVSRLITGVMAGYLGAPVRITVASDGMNPNFDTGTFIGFLHALTVEFTTDADLVGWFVLRFQGPAPAGIA